MSQGWETLPSITLWLHVIATIKHVISNMHITVKKELQSPYHSKIWGSGWGWSLISPNPNTSLFFTDKDAEPAAGPKCTVQGRVWGSEKDHQNRGGLQTAEGPQHHHDRSGTCPCTLLRLLRTAQTLTKWHHSEWRQQPSSQWYEFPRLNTHHFDSQHWLLSHWAQQQGLEECSSNK